MSKRLVQAMREVVFTEGQTGKGRLADAIGRQTRIIETYIEGLRKPTPTNAYKLARECGLNEKEALAIADECASLKSQRTA